MEFEDMFNCKPSEPIRMDKADFVEKTKSLLESLHEIYFKGWVRRVLTTDEYPGENVCENCKGCGVFIENGEEKDCYIDYEMGDCYHRFCDYEQVGMDLELKLDNIIDLLEVNEVIC
jgi:hypothetical protein